MIQNWMICTRGGAIHKGECSIRVSRFLLPHHYHSHGCPTKPLKFLVSYRDSYSQIYAPSKATLRPWQVVQIIKKSRDERVRGQQQQQQQQRHINASSDACEWRSFSGHTGRRSSFNSSASKCSGVAQILSKLITFSHPQVPAPAVQQSVSPMSPVTVPCSVRLSTIHPFTIQTTYK